MGIFSKNTLINKNKISIILISQNHKSENISVPKTTDNNHRPLITDLVPLSMSGKVY